MNIALIGALKFPYGSSTASRYRFLFNEIVSSDNQIDIYNQYPNYLTDNPSSYGEINIYNNRIMRSSNFIIRKYHLYKSSFEVIKKFEKNNKEKQYDIIWTFSNFIFHSLPIIYLSKKHSIPVVNEIMDWFSENEFSLKYFDPHFFDHTIQMKFLNNFFWDGIIAINSNIKEYYGNQNCCVIPSIGNFDNSPKVDLEINPKEIKFGYFGTPSYKDGVLEMVKGFELFNKNKGHKLIIAGQDNRGYLNNIKKYIKQNNLHEFIELKGFIPQEKLLEKFKGVNVLVLNRPIQKLSNFSFPQKVAEYLMLGKPIIITNFNDINHYFDHKKNAYIIDSNRPKSILRAFEYFEKNFNEITKMQKSAFEIGKNIFSAKKNSEKILKFFAKVINNYKQ
ncbi:glycosyltransferase [Halanaerobium kushneri]|uniref:Glycosyltransferase involved in cell wall bisynthesis n=1 Tax=Halanaerobium kushneri TaxID=56779 RepID=A0A1N6RPL3_9FIRM|nr:glycosyltransferase [Halanaerobium kushneri]SIQ30828.1 Glycosyltransferase involved in cell wall bisynthesis [Halanaerobium kushneri]